MQVNFLFCHHQLTGSLCLIKGYKLNIIKQKEKNLRNS
jgi:hypothetical protein